MKSKMELRIFLSSSFTSVSYPESRFSKIIWYLIHVTMSQIPAWPKDLQNAKIQLGI